MTEESRAQLTSEKAQPESGSNHRAPCPNILGEGQARGCPKSVPNEGLQATAHSLRSCLASAISGA
jgi:hypothetical protein